MCLKRIIFRKKL